jgi:glutathione S-transferase
MLNIVSYNFYSKMWRGDAMSTIRFYSGTKNASSWAMRAWLALRAANVEFEEEIVDIRRPQRFPNLAAISRFSPPGMVPVLVVDDEVIFDSLAIMEFANDVSGGALLPQHPIRRAQARAIASWQHSGLSGLCSRISFESAFYPFKRRLTAGEQTECCRLFDWIERILITSGGPYLFGPASLADFALAPTIIRLTRHDLRLENWPLSSTWTATLLAHDRVVDWLAAADRLPHIWFDDYLVPADEAKYRDHNEWLRPA